MNANELADYLDNNVEAMFACEQVHIDEAAVMLRQFGLAESIIKQQQVEIERLKDEVAEWKMSYENCHRMCGAYGMN
jgi:hypothetical protein